MSQLAEKTGSHVTDIRRMTIWGNHSVTQYPDVSHCRVKGKAAKELVDDAWLRDDFIPTVQKRGAAIIRRAEPLRRPPLAPRPSTTFTTGSWAPRTTTGSAWPSPRTATATASKRASSTRSPVTCRSGDYQIVQGLEIDDFSRERMDATEAELFEERAGVEELLP